MEFLDHVREIEIKSRTGRIAVLAAILAVLVIIFFLAKGNDGELTEADALRRVPFLAMTEEELALADTILDCDDFRNALSYDLVENSTVFSAEETWDVYSSVIPENAQVTEVCVIGAVVNIDYRLPQYRVILSYVDADRSGRVDQIRKTLAPMIDGVSTGCYQVDHNLTTGKTVYSYMKF